MDEDSVSESLSDVGDESDDNVNETTIVSKSPIMNFMNEIGDEGDDDIVDIQDKIHLDFWNESENKIRLGMLFENKDLVCESKSSFWIAKCKTLGCEVGSYNIDPYTPQCAWYVRAMKKKNHHMWKITRWVDEHNCFGSCRGNDNKSLNSATIAFYIICSIEKDIAYPVKHIQEYIKNILNVDDFEPSINAFRLCRHVISIDACHLRGSYKGKMLIVVTKDANNNILPVSYAIIDEETTHSWSWFLYPFRHFFSQDRQLCVISDRHRGMVHAMENLEEWKEPLGYHRFCLQHIRSNLMKKYKNVRLKSFCWDIGSTT
uniref:MULE transposase domain-containing protein n=1 Tax=Lactuca sativa TaxID=4236 RepID=A0A9R1WUQ2_LACSA|nr:hypothetical protein LSAT_V11C800424140 [Lactuca sativa]